MKNISKAELKKLINCGEDCILIDVRNPEELNEGKIEKSHNIPLPELQKALEMDEKSFEKKYKFKLDKNKRIILYCKSGGRSCVACSTFEKNGYKTENLSGGYMFWN